MSSFTLTEKVVLETEECCNCGVLFALPRDLKQTLLRQTDRYFYCPNGHSQHYMAESFDAKVKRLERRIEEEKNAVSRQRERAEAIERSRRAVKGQLTKTKKRIANGVCPCCNRTFMNLGDHMKSEHPSYVNPAGEEES